MLKRIRFHLPALALVALLAMPSGALAAKTVWNINIFGPPRAVTKGIEYLKAKMEAASNGQFEMNLQYGSVLGPEKQTPDGIKIGAFEGGQMCVGYYPNKFPLLSVMELPFLAPRDIHENAKVYADILRYPPIVKEMHDRWNVKYLAPVLLPPYEFMGNKRISSTEDMKGVKMRISGLNAEALQVFGAVPTMVTAPEGYQALDRGTIDSFGFPWTYAFGAYKLYEVSKYATDGIGMSGFMCFQGVSQDAYDKLPDNLKKVIDDSQQGATDALIEAYAAADKKWLPIFKQKLEVVPFPPAERAKLAQGAGKFWNAWAKEQDDAGRPGTQVLNYVKQEVAKYSK
ncbi:MAG TPA: TRAP transporter substrate-binding protein DctP [Mariprofundaceae bacterium]|nr:TRAP transporter substrate-binding protein DctP [Mariprofundaceae bacterium]